MSDDGRARGSRAGDAVVVGFDAARLFDGVPYLVALTDPDTTVRRVGPDVTEVLGWCDEELVGRRLSDLVDPEHGDAGAVFLDAVIAGQAVRRQELRIRCRDGSYRWVTFAASFDPAGDSILWIGHDVEPERALERQMRDRIRTEELLASVAASLVASDPHDCMEDLESALGRIAAMLDTDRAYFVRSDARGEDVTVVEWTAPGIERPDHDRARDSDEVTGFWERLMREGEVLQVAHVDALSGEDELAGKALAMQRVRSLLVVPVPSHRRFFGFIALMTVDRERMFTDDAVAMLRIAGEVLMAALDRVDAAAALADATAELAHRNDELEQSNEELERFAYAAAHDLKAPLSRVEMALTTLRGMADDGDPVVGELLDVATRGAVRMRALITDLLAYATVGEGLGQPEDVDLARVVDAAVADLAPLIREQGATVEVEPLPHVPGHPSLLGQLFTNLLSNALKFVRADRSPLVRVVAESGAQDVVVSVRDNGLGIPSADRARVFGMFTRLQAAGTHPGSGIGLATAARVVAIHGGRIWVTDGIDGGAAVCVSLPAIRR